MRNYRCYFYYRSKDNLILYPSSNEACWAGIRDRTIYEPNADKYDYYKETLSKDLYDINYIYIKDYIQPEISEIDRNRVIYLINKIVECSYIVIDNVKYIKVKLLDNYDSNLIILNIIRMFWYHPGYFNITQYYKDIHKRRTKNEDSLSFILKCIKDNVSDTKNKLTGYESYGDHSIIRKGILLKTRQDLLNYKGTSTIEFLTT